MAKEKGEVEAVDAQVVEAEKKADEILEKLETPQSTEAEAEEPAQDLEQLNSQLESLKKDLEKAQTESKAHQRNVSKKDEEVQKLQSRQTNSVTKDEFTVLTQMVADLMDRDTAEGEEAPKQRRSEQYLKKIDESTQKQSDETKETAKRDHDLIINEVLAQFTLAGIDSNLMSTPEFTTAENLFLKGKSQEGLEEVKRVIATKTEAKPTEKEIEDRIIKKYLTKKGDLDAETGHPTGASGISMEGLKSYDLRGKSDEQMKKDVEDVLSKIPR